MKWKLIQTKFVQCVFFSLLIASSQPATAEFKSRVGVGMQYGGLVGYQGSVIFGKNNIRASLGYTGFTFGYDRHLGSHVSLGVQTFLNQYLIGYGLNLNYHLNKQNETGWVFGVDLYQGYDPIELAFESYFDLFFDQDEFDLLDTEKESGALVSIGYQF